MNIRKPVWRGIQARAPLGVMLLGLFLLSCVSPITHPVYLRDQGTPEAGRFSGVAIGLQAFADRRQESDRFLIGYRDLGGGKRERYATMPVNVAEAVTRTAAQRLERMGARVLPAKGWDHTPEAMERVETGADYLIAGEVVRLRCDAERALLGTTLRVEAQVVFYIGGRGTGQVNRRPVQVGIERFEAIFKPEKIERLVNEALVEILDRGLKDLG